MRLFLHQLRGEQRLYWRSRELAFFTFLFPVLIFVLAGLTIMLDIRREDGVIKRLRATPLPPETYLVAAIASTVIVFALEAATLIVLARLLFHVHFPHEWLSLVLALLLGTLSFAALGLALTGFIRSGEGSSAVVNAIYQPTAILSGSFWSPHAYPRFLEVIAEILPLTYFIRLMRDIVLRNETIWANWESAAAVAAWGIAGLVLAVRSFRWEPREG